MGTCVRYDVVGLGLMLLLERALMCRGGVGLHRHLFQFNSYSRTMGLVAKAPNRNYSIASLL